MKSKLTQMWKNCYSDVYVQIYDRRSEVDIRGVCMFAAELVLVIRTGPRRRFERLPVATIMAARSQHLFSS